MSDQRLTVAALRTTVEAELIRSKLETAGIAAVLLEPATPADGTPAARVQVQVSPPDFERAMQLLFPIPQRARPAKTEMPSWKCPKCGEQVMGQFPACWKCGTAREGGAAASVSLPSASAAGTMPPSVSPSLPPARPMPQAPLAASAPLPPLDAPPRISMPDRSPPHPVEVPPIPPVPPATAAEPSRPATNGDSPSIKPVLVQSGRTRTAEEEGLKIVVPAWDAAIGTSRQAAKKTPTEADDRAARRAWWAAVLGAAFAGINGLGFLVWGHAWATAVCGLLCPPLMIYSIGVVFLLGLTGRELSSRGNRFFYGALAINTMIIAAAFAWLGMHR